MFVQGFWYGGSLVLSGRLGAGDVIMVFWSALMGVSALQNLSPQILILEKGKAASAEVSLFGSITPERLAPVMEATRVGDIELKNVPFKSVFR
jgi:ATP-binding cassette subfamily B (MDR/TAP) protein 1